MDKESKNRINIFVIFFDNRKLNRKRFVAGLGRPAEI